MGPGPGEISVEIHENANFCQAFYACLHYELEASLIPALKKFKKRNYAVFFRLATDSDF